MRGDRYAVIATEEVSCSVGKLAATLARVKGILLFPASSFVRDHPGIFDRNAPPALAERLRYELGELGVAAALVDEEDMPEIGAPVTI